MCFGDPGYKLDFELTTKTEVNTPLIFLLWETLDNTDGRVVASVGGLCNGLTLVTVPGTIG